MSAPDQPRPSGFNRATILTSSRLDATGRVLTPKERQVLALIGQGYGGREVAVLLGMAYGTLRKHRLSILAKLGLQSSAQLAAVAVCMATPEQGDDLDLPAAGRDLARASARWRFISSRAGAARKLPACSTSVP